MTVLMRARMAKSGGELGDRVTRADSFFSRAVGLLGRSELEDGEGLLISPCNSIHTFFMRFPIDVAYLNTDHVIVRLATDIKPNRIGPYVREAHAVLELPAGSIRTRGASVGDRLVFDPS